MPLPHRLLVSLVIAIPASAIYNGFTTTGDIAFVFNQLAAISFSLTAIVCVLISGINVTANSSANSSANNTDNSSTNRAAKPARGKSKGREVGSVKWFSGSKGFGFITRENGEEIFVHFRSMQKNSKRLSPGLNVEFAVVNGEKGPEASDVVVV